MDINQMFSCISRGLWKNKARTLIKLIREFGINYSPAIQSSLLTFMYDMKQWMAGCAVSNLPDYIHQHQFKLIQGPGGRAHLYFKKWSMWSPPKEIVLLQKLLTGNPTLVMPDIGKLNLPMLQQAIPKYGLHFDAPTTNWWEDFIWNEGQVEETTPGTPPQWMLTKLTLLPLDPLAERPATGVDIPDTLEKLVQWEQREVEVI